MLICMKIILISRPHRAKWPVLLSGSMLRDSLFSMGAERGEHEKGGKAQREQPSPTRLKKGHSQGSDGMAAQIERKRNCCAQHRSLITTGWWWRHQPCTWFGKQMNSWRKQYKVTTSGSAGQSQVPARWDQGASEIQHLSCGLGDGRELGTPAPATFSQTPEHRGQSMCRGRWDEKPHQRRVIRLPRDTLGSWFISVIGVEKSQNHRTVRVGRTTGGYLVQPPCSGRVP